MSKDENYPLLVFGEGTNIDYKVKLFYFCYIQIIFILIDIFLLFYKTY
jgi:hypothetical protein